MFKEVLVLVVLAIATSRAQHGHGHVVHEKPGGESYVQSNSHHANAKKIDIHSHPKYEYKYGIAESHTGDHHGQHEVRDGDAVHGEYSLHEADGTIRVVKYTADHKNGFNAQVIRKGHAQHPQNEHQSHFVVPVQVHGHHGGQ